MKFNGREVDNETVMHAMIISLEYLKARYGDEASKMPEHIQIIMGGMLQELAELYGKELKKSDKKIKKTEKEVKRLEKAIDKTKPHLTIKDDQLTI